MKVLGIEESVYFDPSKIKVIDSIAGAGKSTATHQLLTDNSVDYLRLTSTNALKKDAQERFNITVKTVAAGLFINDGFKFYNEFDYPTQKTVVIDEVLQTHPRVIEWIKENHGDYNVIVTTDSRQMLAPECEKQMQRVFDELCNNSDTVYSNITKTLRARNKKTEDAFNEYYELAKEDILFNVSDIPFIRASYENIDYDPNNAYITHTNDIEHYFYCDKELAKRYDLDLLPKGYISAKGANPHNYPILSQKQAIDTKARAYFQVANIGTPTRFQGSEVIQGNTLYYMVNEDSKVSARELYTTITRLWDINDIRIVVVPKRHFTIKTFNNLPIYEEKTAVIDYLASIDKEHAERAQKVKDDLGCFMPEQITAKQMKAKIDEYTATHRYKLKPNEIYQSRYIKDKSGDIVYYVDIDDIDLPETKDNKCHKVTARSLISHEGPLQYSYVQEIYNELEKHNVDHIISPHARNRYQKDIEFELDLYSAYPHILKFCDIPYDGLLTFKEDTTGERMNFYLYNGDELTDNSIIEDSLKDYVVSHNMGTVTYLFSTPKGKSGYIGDWLWSRAHKDIESKQLIKSIHYGYYQKPYLNIDGSADKEYYVKNDRYRYEILMACICSILLRYMLEIKEKVNGAFIKVDAVYFEDIEKCNIEEITRLLPTDFHFRIKQHHKNSDDSVVYQTYEDLKHQKATQKAKQRANMTDEEKEIARKNDRERKRLARAKKRALENSKKD